ncbi:MAG TPA: 2-dehydropantoate 2-reductase [Firmicutes bacterium]|jgi:2-dehydropantoate 2-reductase|nr:2-dehydropantoate 2-reductase [Bacillota bacterium]
MKEIQKVYISGLGAIGSAYASLLFEADPALVTVIADPERIGRYQKNGITVNGKPYPFQYSQPGFSQGPADLILIAVKQHHLEQSIRDIRDFVAEHTIILSLLNGITSEEIIGRTYGDDKLLFSFVVGTDATREGTSTRFANIGKIVFGDKMNRNFSPKVAAVKELFDRVGIPYQIPEDMLRELWWKFMMNVGINQTSAILKAPYGVFQKVAEARELMAMASREVIHLAERNGINLCEADIQKYIQVIDTISAAGKTSMLQDVEACRKTEVETFAGTVIELGKKYGVETPVNQILYRMIKTLEQTYLGG